jgi:DNA modification methylase
MIDLRLGDCLEVMKSIPDKSIDPYCGSGTVGVACKELGRNFIGIEISPEYFKIAEKRINNTQEMML